VRRFFFRCGDNGVGFFNGAGDRFFEQHVATGFEAVDGSGAVQVMRQQDEDRVDFGEAVAIIDECFCSCLSGDFSSPGGFEVGNPDDFCPVLQTG